MSKVLVTGAAGFVGGHLVNRLAEDGDDIVAIDIQEDLPETVSDENREKIEFIRGDITDDEFLDEIFQDHFDRIYHLAAIVGVESYVEDPLSLVDINIIGTRKILERLKGEATRLVFTSTSEIYGKNPDVPWSEDDDRVLGPATVNRWSYSISKSACEHMMHAVHEADPDLETTVIRPFNLYGPGQRPDFAVPAFIDAVQNGERPVVYDEGTQTRCFTYIDDFIEGLVRASTYEEGAGEAFNLGSTEETRIRDLAELVLEISDNEDVEPEFVDTEDIYGDEYEDLQRRIPNVEKAGDLLDWEAKTSLRRGLERILEQLN